jgi:Mg-chelatase subunit ChlD
MTDLTIRTDRSFIRAASRSLRYVAVTVVAPVAPKASERQPIDVAFVLDRSGSMGGQKIELARDAVLQGVAMLQARDRFAVVAYDDTIDVVVPLTSADREARINAERRLHEIAAGGFTDLAGGWLKGCLQLAEAANPAENARCLLMSDGQANRGIVDPQEIQRHATELRRRGITTSTFGVGEDFDERLMSSMGRAGGGQGYFIRQARQIGDLLTSELGETLEVVARNAVLSIALPDEAELEVLSDFDVRDEEGTAEVRLGNLVSGQSVTVVLKLRLPLGIEGQRASLEVAVKADGDALEAPPADLSWTWASHGVNDAQPRDSTVDLEVAAIYAARGRREALELNRQGDFQSARRILERIAAKIERYAGDSRELRSLVSALRNEAQDFSREMTQMAKKQAHYAALGTLQSRSATGKARRARFDAEQFTVELHRGVPVITCGGVRVAIATGTPQSFGSRPLHLLGDGHRLPATLLPNVDATSIGRSLGTPIDVVLGADILSQYQCLLDLGGHRVVFSRGDLGCDGVSLRVPLRHAVPSADVVIGTRPGVAFLDTGARLSYMDPACVSAPPVARERDFFPLLGEFETEVYEVDIEVAGLRFRGRFGVLPTPLQQEIKAFGAQWVIGSELLQQFPLVLDLRNSRILVVLGEPSTLAGIM